MQVVFGQTRQRSLFIFRFHGLGDNPDDKVPFACRCEAPIERHPIAFCIGCPLLKNGGCFFGTHCMDAGKAMANFVKFFQRIHFTSLLMGLQTLMEKINYSMVTSTPNRSPIRLNPSSTVCKDSSFGISTAIVML